MELRSLRADITSLEAASGLTVHLWDERRTTIEAHQILSDHNYHGKKRKTPWTLWPPP